MCYRHERMTFLQIRKWRRQVGFIHRALSVELLNPRRPLIKKLGSRIRCCTIPAPQEFLNNCPLPVEFWGA